MDSSKNRLEIQQKVLLLQDFLQTLENWRRERIPEKKASLRSKLNKNLFAVQYIVSEAGTFSYATISGKHFDPFLNMFMFEDLTFHKDENVRLLDGVRDQIERAIGVFEHLITNSGVIKLKPKEAIDIETAIERALRPSFRDNQPQSEKEVQDAIENILNTLGIEFTRDREVTSVAGKAFKPDFIVGEIDLAIEVKLAKAGHKVGQIQEEINADISAYRTKWKNLLFVIYDLGVIHDPYKFQTENIKLFGVSVRVIKH